MACQQTCFEHAWISEKIVGFLGRWIVPTGLPTFWKVGNPWILTLFSTVVRPFLSIFNEKTFIKRSLPQLLLIGIS